MFGRKYFYKSLQENAWFSHGCLSCVLHISVPLLTNDHWPAKIICLFLALVGPTLWNFDFRIKISLQIFPWVKVFWGEKKWICKSPTFSIVGNHLSKKSNFQIQLWHRWTKYFWNHDAGVLLRNIQEHIYVVFICQIIKI